MDIQVPPALVQLAQAEAQPEAALEPKPIEVDVSRYIPHTAVSVTMLVTVTPPTGAAFIYAPESENEGTLFKGPRTMGDIRLNGPRVYVKLYDGATSFVIQYMNYRVP
jgi:hypothetical protein